MDITELFVAPSFAPVYFVYLISENGIITHTKNYTTLTVDVDPNYFAKETSLEDYMQNIVHTAFFMTAEAAIDNKTLEIESGDIVILMSTIPTEEIQKFAIRYQDFYDVTNQPMNFKFKLKVLEGEITAFEIGCFNNPTETICDFTL